jgi:lipoyl(octanoyl) transferase
MIWYLYDTGFNSGAYNMEFDMSLVKNANDDEAYLRFYRWKPYCISLGAKQDPGIINYEKIKLDKLDYITRPTGGRAVLHAEELTYSVVYTLDQKTSARSLYNKINLALIRGLKIYSSKLDGVEAESDQTNFREHYKNFLSEACFSVPAKSEIKFKDRKLVGSAQRKIGNRILQHGSILCGTFHKKITGYLNINETEAAGLRHELDKKTIELETILNEKINYPALKNSIYKGFEEEFETFLVPLNNEIKNYITV